MYNRSFCGIIIDMVHKQDQGIPAWEMVEEIHDAYEQNPDADHTLISPMLDKLQEDPNALVLWDAVAAMRYTLYKAINRKRKEI